MKQLKTLLVVMATALIAACGEPKDPIYSLKITFCWDEPDAQALAAWPAGTKLALDPEPDYPCAEELEQAKALWKSHGREFHDPSEPGVTLIPVRFTEDLEKTGLTITHWNPSTGLIKSSEIQTRACGKVTLAHEMGHSLGFLVHATRENALMRFDATKDDVSDEELKRLSDREANPAGESCILATEVPGP